MGEFRGPIKRGPGRPKGSKDKVPGLLKDQVLEALHLAGDGKGAVEYLRKQAHMNPAAFLSLIGKIIPAQVALQAEIMHVISADPITADEWEAQHGAQDSRASH